MSDLTEASSMTLKDFIRKAEKTIKGIRINQYVKDATGRVGLVEGIGISPYWAEEMAGILRAYVTGVNGDGTLWADWLAFDEMELV